MAIIEPESDSWAERARMGRLASVLDPKDPTGAKNTLIDRIHKLALARALGSVEGLDVLDFGCGQGRMSAWLVERGARVHGVDASPEMLAEARAAIPEARFTLNDSDELPFDAASYDIVLSVTVLQYFVPDPERYVSVLREFVRVLTPSGRVVALEQIHDGGTGLGRGAELGDYRRGMEQAGLRDISAAPVRTSYSRALGMTSRFPRLASAPLVPQLVVRQARREIGRGRLGEARYGEAVLVAHRA